MGVRWGGHHLPGLCLTFGDHQLVPGRCGPVEKLASLTLLPGRSTAVEIRGSCAEGGDCVAWIEVDADDIGEAAGHRQRITLVSCAPPLVHGHGNRGR